LDRLYPYCAIHEIDYRILFSADLLSEGYLNDLKNSGYDEKFKNEYAILD